MVEDFYFTFFLGISQIYVNIHLHNFESKHYTRLCNKYALFLTVMHHNLKISFIHILVVVMPL